MSRDPRYLDFRRLVEVTVVVYQNRFLIRPSEEVNDLFVGVVGYAQRKLDMEIISLTALSTHWQEIVIAHREASERLRDGDRNAEFPEGTFPCALPFVALPETLMLRSRGQPA